MFLRTEKKDVKIDNKILNLIELYYGVELTYNGYHYTKELTIESLSDAIISPQVRENRVNAYLNSHSLLRFVVAKILLPGINNILNGNIP
jgi:hypothetical protein